jgi:hypothetical protein
MDSVSPKHKPNKQTSIECIQLTINWTNDQVFTCSGRLPTQRNVGQSNPSREPQHMAIINNRKCSQTQPRIRQNPKGTHEAPMPRCTFNQTTQSNIEEDKEEPILDLGIHTETPETTINHTNPITSTKSKAKKMRDVFMKICNASDMCILTKRAVSQQHPAQESNTS